MPTNDNMNVLTMDKSAGEVAAEVALKTPIETDLILEDIPEEEFKKAVRDTVVEKHNSHGDIQSIAENYQEKFYNIYHRESPLTIPANMNGLVGIRTFWQDSQESKNSLYDLCRPENKEQILVATLFPAKQPNVNRFKQTPRNGQAPLSMMAQYLYNQIEELAKIKSAVEGATVGNNKGDCVKELVTRNVDIHKGARSAWVEQDASGVERKTKGTGSSVLRWIRRSCCCVGSDVNE